jgi:hypothetical protein
MSNAEAETFEERLLSDQEFSDAAAICEQELIDDYSAGEVDDANRNVLRTWIEASPRRVQRVRFAQSLITTRSHKARRARRVRFLLPIAAMIAGLAVATWMIDRNNGGSANPAPNTAKSNDVKGGSSIVAKGNGASASADRVILVVAERVRGAQHSQMVAHNQNSAITLQVLLPEGAASGPYHLQVKNSRDGRNIVFDEQGLQPSATGQRLYLVVHIHEGALTVGSYEITAASDEDSFTSEITVQ